MISADVRRAIRQQQRTSLIVYTVWKLKPFVLLIADRLPTIRRALKAIGEGLVLCVLGLLLGWLWFACYTGRVMP
jgi:hypothetical protein